MPGKSLSGKDRAQLEEGLVRVLGQMLEASSCPGLAVVVPWAFPYPFCPRTCPCQAPYLWQWARYWRRDLN